MHKVSVIIPTYNRADLIVETIQSVLNQTYTDFELIVVDDGSTDNTKEVANSFKDPRIKYIYQENSGVSTARNNGIKLSNAEYIAFLDSDDMYLEKMLEKSLQVYDAHPEVGFTYGQSSVMRIGGEAYRVRKQNYHNDSTIIGSIEQVRELLFSFRIDTSTLTARRSCFKEVGGFDEELWFGEDFHLFIRLAKKYAAFYIAEPLIKYRFHSGQALHNTTKPGKEKAFPLVLQEVFEDPEIAPHFKDLKGKAYSYFYGTLLFGSAYGYDMKLARQYLRKAVRYYPGIIFRPAIFYIVYKYLASLLPDRLRTGMRDFKRLFWYTKTQRE